jgi:hypothetical protein
MRFLFLFFIHVLSITAYGSERRNLSSKLAQECPQWMSAQINQDLSSCKTNPISIRKINDYYLQKSPEPSYLLVKFTISNNKVYYEKMFGNILDYRIQSYIQALNKIASFVHLPDMVFLWTVHDALGQETEVPVFIMAKKKGAMNQILLPDYEALREKYQVLKYSDITRYEFPWERKNSQLIWRGSTAQGALDNSCCLLSPHNLHLFSRVHLCELSKKYPHLIDAKFTLFAQGGETIPSLQQFRGGYVSYEKQLEYKYHLLIDGNCCAYSNSGWKFFANSVIFKPDSQWIQWYYQELKPGVHYIPVEDNLDDLVEKIQWAIVHDSEAKAIAHNARMFALEHLTISDHLCYLYHALLRYSQLQFVD